MNQKILDRFIDDYIRNELSGVNEASVADVALSREEILYIYNRSNQLIKIIKKSKKDKQKSCSTCEKYEKTIENILNSVESIIDTKVGCFNIFNSLKVLIQNYRR